MPTNELKNARKGFLTSLRSRLAKEYSQSAGSDARPDHRWINGFMAAGFHSGLISLKELKFECLTAFRDANGRRMNAAQEVQLARRLTRLCENEVSKTSH